MSQSIFPSLAYEDAAEAVDWLCDAFGFERALVVADDDGAVVHAELRSETGDVLMLLSTVHSTKRKRSPQTLGGTAQSVYMAVADLDHVHDRAVTAGAEVFNPLYETAYGSREFCCLDPEGHIWTFGTYTPGT